MLLSKSESTVNKYPTHFLKLFFLLDKNKINCVVSHFLRRNKSHTTRRMLFPMSRCCRSRTPSNSLSITRITIGCGSRSIEFDTRKHVVIVHHNNHQNHILYENKEHKYDGKGYFPRVISWFHEIKVGECGQIQEKTTQTKRKEQI